MEVTFLAARIPLRKKFDHNGKHSYPHAFEFTSTTIDVADLPSFTYLLQRQAELGHCLLKGNTTRELVNESRAGSTNKDDFTIWLCLDADGLSGDLSAEHFLERLGLGGYSYILQWSSSAFLEHDGTLDTTFSAHLFLKLEAPVSPHRLKLWLKHKNFVAFAEDLTLTASDMALRWGLDITTCQNDKLLFISPPDVQPPYRDTLTPEQRIAYYKAEKDEVPLAILGLNDLDAGNIRKQELEIINQLRIEKGLDKKRATSFAHKGTNVEYLANPSNATITDIKEDRGFVYFNLNGGDSWAYYHPVDNIEYIFNFKGEPTYRTEELLPAYYHERTRQAGIKKAGGRIPVGFRGMQDGAVYNGFYDTAKDELELYIARRPADVIIFLAQYGVEIDALPTYRLIHDPHSTSPRLDTEKEAVNLFTISSLERDSIIDTRPTPVIDKILTHVLGPKNVNHFINWWAFIVQYKEASGTSWVLHGCQGTGKGVLFHHVLRPMLGYSNAKQMRTENFEDSYNGFLENTQLIAVDEVDVPESRKDKVIMANLKNYQTEKTISIRKMYANVYEVINLLNFIFMSNQRNPIWVEATDRRFNIADYQDEPINLTTQEIEELANELPAFMHHILCYPVDRRKAQTAAITQAKIDMQALSETSVDQIANALIRGQASVLHSFCDDESEILDFDQKLLVQRYNTLIKEVICEKRDRFSRADLRTIFEATVGKVPNTPAKFTKYLKHHGIEVGSNRIGDKIERGSLVVEWRDSPEWFAAAQEEYETMPAPEKTDIQPAQNDVTHH
jgi:hypothetical protein